MTGEAITQKILDIFQEARKNPSADYDSSHFMDFLNDPPYEKNTIKNSFIGVRKYYRFMDALELEFGICFSLSDLDKYYSVDTLTKKVLARINKGKGNKMILQRRLEEKNSYWIEIMLFIIPILIFLWLGLHLITIIVAIFCEIGIYWILSNKNYDKRHNKRMTERLKLKNEKQS